MKLSNREQQVLVHLSEGKTIKLIAQELYLSPSTIITYLKNLKYKLDALNVAHLIRKGFEHNLLSNCYEVSEVRKIRPLYNYAEKFSKVNV